MPVLSRWSPFLIAMTVGLVSPAFAQDPFWPGMKVRIWTNRGADPVVGLVARQTADSLEVTAERGIGVWRFHRPEITSAERAIRHPARRGRGALIGAGIGLAFGAGVGVVARSGVDDAEDAVVCGFLLGGCSPVVTGISGALLGAGIGALASGPRERWLAITLPAAAGAITGGGIALRVALPVRWH